MGQCSEAFTTAGPTLHCYIADCVHDTCVIGFEPMAKSGIDEDVDYQRGSDVAGHSFQKSQAIHRTALPMALHFGQRM